MKKIHQTIIGSFLIILILNMSIIQGVLSQTNDEKVVLREVGLLTGFNDIVDIIIDDNLGYIADGYGGLKIIKITDSINITHLGHYFDGGYAHNLDIEGDFVYIGDGVGGLEIIDVSDKSNPIEIGSDNTGYPVGINVRENIAYVGDREQGLRILNVSDPYNPMEIGRYGDGQDVGYVKVVGDIAYLRLDGLKIIDISNPREPKLLGQYNNTGPIVRLEIVENFVYAADLEQGLVIFDVSDLANPIKLGQFNDGGQTMDVQVIDNLAFIADSTGGLEIIDVSDVENPKKVGEFVEIGDDVMSVHLEGEIVYVGNRNRGLVILQIEKESENVSGWSFLIFLSALIVLISVLKRKSKSTWQASCFKDLHGKNKEELVYH